MIINVFFKDKCKIIKIDSTKIDTTKHFHLNSYRPFTKEELLNFGVTEENKTSTKKVTRRKK